MGNQQKSALFCLIAVCLASIAYAEYDSVSGDAQNYYASGSGYFNSVAFPSGAGVTYNYLLYESEQPPLVFDWDGNGLNEIIFLDAGVLWVLDEEGTFIANYNTGETTTNRMLAHDVEADGIMNLVLWSYAVPSSWFYVVSFNGSDFTLHGSNETGNTYDIACRDSDGYCLATTQPRTECAMGQEHRIQTRVLGYGIIDPIRALTFPLNRLNCNPQGNAILTYDYDSDGREDFIIPYLVHGDGGCNHEFKVVSLNVTDGVMISLDTLYTSDSLEGTRQSLWCNPNLLGGQCSDCQTTFTPMSLGQFTSDNTLDMAIGYQVSDETYKLAVYDGVSGFADIETYPTLLTGSGRLMSPPVWGTFFPELTTLQAGRSVCVLGYNYTTGGDEISALCATMVYRGLALPQSDEFTASVAASGYTLTDDVFFRNVYAAEMRYMLQGTQSRNLDELITPFGIFRFEYSGSNRLEPEFTFTDGAGAYFPVDLYGNNRLQLVGTTGSNILTITDGWRNTQAYFAEGSEIDPCVEAAWRLNTSVKFVVKGLDEEGDAMSARVQLYYDEAGEIDSGWSANSSGTSGVKIFQFSNLLPNQSTSNSFIRLSLRDVENNFDYPPAERIIPFSVTDSNDTGLVMGDCVFSFGGETEVGEGSICSVDSDCSSGQRCISGYCVAIPDSCSMDNDCPTGYYCFDGSCEEEASAQDNALTDSSREIARLTGIPVTVFVLLLIFLSLYVVATSNVPAAGKTTIAVFLPFLVFGSAAFLGLISAVWVVIYVVILLIVGAVTAGSLVRGGG